jgi:hypothetical protein
VRFGLSKREIMTEILVWWKGLAKELELDIETFDEKLNDDNL